MVIIKKRITKRKTNSEFIKEIYGLVDNEYEFLEGYKNSSTKILCKHNLCEHEYSVSPNAFLRGNRCPKCSSNKKKTDRKFIEEVFQLVGNEYIFLQGYINTKTKILCRHNLCGYEWKVKPNSFLQGSRCPECSKKLSKKTNEEFLQEVYDLVGNEYAFLEGYKNTKTKILCIHNLCGHEYRIRPSHFLEGRRCPKCAIKSRRKTNEAFTKEIYHLVGNEYTFVEKYVSAHVKILCRHNLCGHEYKVTPDNFIATGNRCPECSSSARRTNEEFIEKVFDLVEDEYNFLEEYVSAKTEILCKHNLCGHEWRLRPSNFLIGARCPICGLSKGEAKVRDYLNNNNITFEMEYPFPDLVGVGGGLLKFDFAIFQNNKPTFLIEYDGEFHYNDIHKDGGFEAQQIHDERKNQYCKDNNIPLLRIPYWEFDNIEKILEEFMGLADMRSDIF